MLVGQAYIIMLRLYATAERDSQVRADMAVIFVERMQTNQLVRTSECFELKRVNMISLYT